MSQKNCLLIFKNKKLNNFEQSLSTIAAFSAEGIYFDRVEYCAYDDAEEISRSIKECKCRYSNIVLLCPKVMCATLKSYCEKLFEGQFSDLNILSLADHNLYLLPYDGETNLKLDDLIQILVKNCNVSCVRTFVKTVGAQLAQINKVIVAAKEVCADCVFNVSEKFSDCTIEIVYPAATEKSICDNVLRIVLSGLNDYVYALENVTLAQRLFQLLKLRRMKISVAESFTGGGVSKRLVVIPGISEVFFEGLNTYANESKIKRLGVQDKVLKQYGAVSEQTAYQMAEGLLNTGDCDISVATTGIAGPKSDSTAKPVGLLYIAVGTRETISVYKYNLNGDRQTITETAINLALFHAFKMLK